MGAVLQGYCLSALLLCRVGVWIVVPEVCLTDGTCARGLVEPSMFALEPLGGAVAIQPVAELLDLVLRPTRFSCQNIPDIKA